MNLEKFNHALEVYVKHCETSTWITEESYKFYFANWLFKKVNLGLQSNEKIYQNCRQSLKRDYSLKRDLSNIGVNFLQKSGREKLSIPIKMTDIEIVQFLKDNDIPNEDFFKRRGTSYPALAAWLGTLLPKQFVPLGTSDFHETVTFLFDLEDFPRGGYKFFLQTQKYFKETKQHLKAHNLERLYIENINQYLKENDYKKSIKKKYEELDWNWITQDFHLFIFRKYLHDRPFKKAQRQNTDLAAENSADCSAMSTL